MVWSGYHNAEKPKLYKAGVRNVYCWCIVASVFSIVILAYATSFKSEHGHIPKYSVKQLPQRRNITEEASSMPVGGYLKKSDDDPVRLTNSDPVRLSDDDPVRLNGDPVQLRHGDHVRLNGDDVRLGHGDAVRLSDSGPVRLNDDNHVQLNDDNPVRLSGDDPVWLNGDSVRLSRGDPVRLSDGDPVRLNDDPVGLDTRTDGHTENGGLELHWEGNSRTSTSASSEHPVTQTPPDSRMLYSTNVVNCSLDTYTTDFSLPHLNFLHNYKNPCWYEDMVRPNVYDRNKFRGATLRKLFNTLTEEWTKKLNTDAQPKRLRCLPYFFIAGQPKCGSTDLYVKLMSHPDIATPPIKEPHWWAKCRFGGHNDINNPVPFRDYVDLYDKAALLIEHTQRTTASSQSQDAYHQLITGDASVSTLWFNDYWWELPENCGESEPKFTNAHYVKIVLPDSRIIVILRNPTERLYSDYLYFQRNGKSPDNFHIEVRIAIESFNYCLNSGSLRSCIYNKTVARASKVRLRIGMYYVFLEEWLRIFPRNQMHVVRLEDYAQVPLDILRQLFRFLDLRALTPVEEDQFFTKPKVANSRRIKDMKLGDMRPDTREILDNFYMHYNQKLAILMHDARFLWNS